MEFGILSRPEKSLHLLFKNPDTSLHIFYNPKYRLHLPDKVKRKRAMLRSNSSGLAWSVKHIIRYLVYTLADFFYMHF